jgi:hypothetical protein
LGLSQVYGFVKQSNGAISVSSTIGAGTVFTILIPRYSGDPKLSSDKVIHDELLRNSGSETILVIDDELLLQELSVDILKRNGYKALVAQNVHHLLEI